MTQETSYCLDIFIDGDTSLRKEIVELLKKNRDSLGFEIGEGQFGNWEGLISLRILTPKPKLLTEYIIKNIKFANNYSYDEHSSEKKANSSRFWKPEKNKTFDFILPCIEYTFKL